MITRMIHARAFGDGKRVRRKPLCGNTSRVTWEDDKVFCPECLRMLAIIKEANTPYPAPEGNKA